MMQPQRNPIRLLLLLLPLALLWGCSGSSNNVEAPPPAKKQQDIAAQLKAIDADPHMPPQAKAMAKAQVMAHSGKTAPQQ